MIKLFNEGNRDKMFIHFYVKGRKRKLNTNEIEDDKGRMLKDDNNIGDEAVQAFQVHFHEIYVDSDAMLSYIHNLLSKEHKKMMDRQSTGEEMRNTLFSLNSESASVPDDFSNKDF